MGYETEKAAIKEVAEMALNEGLRVFIAESGTYGFFTDTEGERCVYFQMDYFTPVFSGCYKTDNPRQTGIGWRITDHDDPFPNKLRPLLNATPPRWAVPDTQWRYTTLDEQLAMYQKSSKYVELHKETKGV